MLYEKLFKSLYRHQISYVVIGGIAVNLHGYLRTTVDLDIVISLDKSEILKFIKIVQKLGYLPRLPVKMEDLGDERIRKEWIQKKNMKVFSIYNPKNPADHIDIMTEQHIPFKSLLARRVLMRENDFVVSVASIPDLIKLKKIAGRDRDLIDIGVLRRIHAIKKKK